MFRLATLVLLLCAACRTLLAEDYWIEAHGQAAVRQVAASPRGIDVIGTNRELFHYPGDFGVPWKPLKRMAAQAIATSLRSIYALDADGFVSVIALSGASKRLDHSGSWHATALACDEGGQLYVVADARAWQVRGKQLVALACAGPATTLAAAQGRVYVVSPEGALSVADGNSCQAMPAPGALTSVSAFEERLTCTAAGRVYEHSNGGWRVLPRPVRYRSTGRTEVSVVQVATSAQSIWVRDAEGFVYVLSEPS